ncbi:hypothetical protein CJ231_02350 [Hoylesella buccalis]|uniref:Uncharacterized protein n=1 Tax=Hoylesella buccalis TaxID=28127 RepID=A0A2N6QU92_9BACT|nr:hypothetical protein CJ231_02350 [Hoylesella buccalis]
MICPSNVLEKNTIDKVFSKNLMIYGQKGQKKELAFAVSTLDGYVVLLVKKDAFSTKPCQF